MTIEDVIQEALSDAIPKILDVLVDEAQEQIIEDFYRRYQDLCDFKKAKEQTCEANREYLKKLEIRELDEALPPRGEDD